MSGSYRKINYFLRPSKSIERKMLAEAMGKMSNFGQLSKYRYLGFGSTYFSDFKLFHKVLGFKKMVSIEGDVHSKNRFKFNRPFSCVRMEFGTSTSVFPRLSWNEKNIVWLDYDGILTSDVLSDVSFCMANIPAGSMFIVTVNANAVTPETEITIPANERPERRLDSIKDRLGEDKIPIDINSPKQLTGWGTADLYRRIILNEISEILSQRNGGSHDPFIFEQLFHFRYADGAKMLTIGGVIFRQTQRKKFLQCNFDQIDFIRTGDDPYLIDPPNLTFKEIHFIDRHLPTRIRRLKLDGLPQEDIMKYAKLYRYFPTFSETEI